MIDRTTSVREGGNTYIGRLCTRRAAKRALEEAGMVGERAVLAVILGGVLAACGAGAAPPTPPAALATAASDVTITPGAASPTQAATPLSPSPSGTPRATPKPTPKPAPPKPSGVMFDEQGKELADGRYSVTYTVRWQAPRAASVKIRVYGVTDCLVEPSPFPAVADNGPCLVEHTSLPASALMLLATASASDGIVSWTWTGDVGCDVGWHGMGPHDSSYRSVVLAAYGSSGHSIFAIAQPGEWVSFDPDAVVC